MRHYRFELHPDFTEWRLPLLDALCRQFQNEALILAQYHTTWFSLAEFEMVAFKLIEPDRHPLPMAYLNEDRAVRFLVCDNTLTSSISISDYPTDCPPAEAKHQEWLESRSKWEGRC